MMRCRIRLDTRRLALAVLPLFLAGCATEAVRPDLGKVGDPKAWRVVNGELAVSDEGGRSVVRLSPIGGNRKGSNVAMALFQDVSFAVGTIEIDLRGNASGQASFVGVAFGVTDAAKHEAVYFRPFNFLSADPVRRAHGVQYVSWPEHTWEKLRAEKPGAYEAAVAPVPDPVGWFHARVEVTEKRVRVFVDRATRPCLVVDRLGNASKGAVGLWVDSQDAAFADLRILPGR